MNLTFSRLNCNFWLKISHLSVPYSDIWSLGCILYELCTLRHPVSMGLLLSEKFRNSKNLDTKAWSVIPFLAVLKCYVSSHKFLHNLSGWYRRLPHAADAWHSAARPAACTIRRLVLHGDRSSQPFVLRLFPSMGIVVRAAVAVSDDLYLEAVIPDRRLAKSWEE